MSADWWQNFANNFAADLAPLLSLFGEQPTKQFLSETLTLVDIVIFSIAPIGVLTAVVSAIRVGGDPSLRAFIGRAQEGGGIAEAELCSSTSRDVCELYNNGGIMRVFGRPKILEVVHDPSKKQDDKAGIFTFKEYVEGEGKGDWRENGLKVGDEDPITKERPFAVHPNLSLNIGIKKLPLHWSYLAAIFGLVLQSGVLLFAAMATYAYPEKFKRDDTQISVPAFPFAFVGTIFLCFGVGMCATIVDKSTGERTFKRVEGSTCRFHWIQPGGQVIGDQVFDSFAYSDTQSEPLREYTTSWKLIPKKAAKKITKETTQDPTKTPIQKLSKELTKRFTEGNAEKGLLVWVAIFTACVGFVLQFLGLRTLHSTVSAAQFIVMLIMSMVRALLRTQRLKKNLMGDSYTLYQHHELDWLAIRLAAGDSEDSEENADRPIWRIISFTAKESSYLISFSPSPQTPRVVANLPSLDEEVIGTEEVAGAEDALDPKDAYSKRLRLACLTGAQSDSQNTVASSLWGETMIPARQLATKLARALEDTMAVLSDGCTLKPGFKDAVFIKWQIPCSTGFTQETTFQIAHEKTRRVAISMSRDPGKPGVPGAWRVSRPELEAVLGLWLWSIKLIERPKPTEEDENDEQSHTLVRCSRIMHFFRNSNETPSGTDLMLWLNQRNATTAKLCPLERLPEPGSKWVKRNNEEKKDDEEFSPAFQREGQQSRQDDFVRFFGWHLMSKTNWSEQIKIWEAPSKSPLELMCAQEIFAIFLMEMASKIQDIQGRTEILRGPQGLYLESQMISEMIQSFTTSGIGSEEDGLACIVPILHAHRNARLFSTTLAAAINDSYFHRKQKEWNKGEEVLLRALDLCLQELRNEHDPDSQEHDADSQEHDVDSQKHKRDGQEYAIQRDLCILSLYEFYRWALLQDKPAILLALDGISSIYKRHDHSCPILQEIHNYLEVALYISKKNVRDEEIQSVANELPQQLAMESRNLANIDFTHALDESDLTATLYLLRKGECEFDSRKPAIVVAARNGWYTVVKSLQELGADCRLVDEDGCNYLHYAAQTLTASAFLHVVGGNEDLIEKPDNDGRTPLHSAAAAGNMTVARLLVEEFSMSSDQEDRFQKSAITYALLNGNLDLVTFFMDVAEAESSGAFRWSAEQKVHWIVFQAACYSNFMVVEALIHRYRYLLWHIRLQAREVSELGDEDSDEGKCISVIHQMYESSFVHWTLLRPFRFRGQPDLGSRSSEESGPLSFKDFRRTALFLAVEANKPRLINFILSNPQGGDIDNKQRMDLLCFAVQSGSSDAVKALLPVGTNVDIEGDDGLTLLMIAKRLRQLKIATLLLSLGAARRRLSIPGSAISATETRLSDHHIFFQDTEHRIRRVILGRHATEPPEDRSSTILCKAKPYTPLVSLRRKAGLKLHISVFFISEENLVNEFGYTVGEEDDGRVRSYQFEASNDSSIAAVSLGVDNVLVYYQDPTGKIQELLSSGEFLLGGSHIATAKAFPGSQLAAITGRNENSSYVRVFYQDKSLRLMAIEKESHQFPEVSRWAKGKVVSHTAAKYTPIVAFGGHDARVLWFDQENSLIESSQHFPGEWKKSNLCAFGNSEIPCHMCGIGGENGRPYSLYHQKKDGEIREKCIMDNGVEEGMEAVCGIDVEGLSLQSQKDRE